MKNINEYVELVKAPWGRMFYDLLFEQINIPQSPRLKILDFGSGLCVTSNHFAAWHDIIAVEPNKEMTENSYRENTYTQVHGGIEQVEDFENNAFDAVFCHNVLEYVERKEPFIETFLSKLKPNGLLSIVKHNRVGRVFHRAVFWNDPKKALSMIDSNANDKNEYLGTQYIYSNDDLEKWVKNYGGKLVKTFGMRTFWALGQDNDIKHTNEWYKNMLDLERKASEIDEYQKAAFHNHLLFRKHQ